jgi:hypothetical protein
MPTPVAPAAPPRLHVQLAPGSPAGQFLAAQAASRPLLLERVHALPETLSLAEQWELLTALREGLSHFYALSRPDRRHVWNDLANALSTQQFPSPDYIPVMTAVAHDPACDPGVRDYALQYMGHWLERRDLFLAAGPESIPFSLDDHSRAAVASLSRAATEPSWSSSGTALMALSAACGGSAKVFISGDTLGSLAKSLVLHPRPHSAALTTALQVLAMHSDIAPLAAQFDVLATDPARPAAIRTAAYTALARCGKVRPELTSLFKASRDPRLLAAAKTTATPSER